MRRLREFMLLACLVQLGCTQQPNAQLDCPGSLRKTFTSDDTNIDQVYADDQGLSQTTPRDNLLSANLNTVWCVYDPLPFNGNTAYVVFKSPVLLDTIITEGALSGGSMTPEYVSNFSVYYKATDEDSLQLLQTYQVPSENVIQLAIDELFQVKMLNLAINNAQTTSDYYCWNLKLIGCLLSDAVTSTSISTAYNYSTVTSTETGPTMTVTSTITKTVTAVQSQSSGGSSVESSPAGDSTDRSTGNDQQVLLGIAIGLPSVLLLLLLLFIIITVVLVIRERKRFSLQTSQQPILAELDNSEFYRDYKLYEEKHEEANHDTSPLNKRTQDANHAYDYVVTAMKLADIPYQVEDNPAYVPTMHCVAATKKPAGIHDQLEDNLAYVPNVVSPVNQTNQQQHI